MFQSLPFIAGGGGGLCVQAGDPRAAVGGVLAAGGQRHARLLHLGQPHAGGQVGPQGKEGQGQRRMKRMQIGGGTEGLLFRSEVLLGCLIQYESLLF